MHRSDSVNSPVSKGGVLCRHVRVLSQAIDPVAAAGALRDDRRIMLTSWVGFLGYDAARDVEHLADQPDGPMPRYEFFLPETLVRFESDRTVVIGRGPTPEHAERAADGAVSALRTQAPEPRPPGPFARLAPDRVILSPGPCAPDQAGISLDVVRRLGSRIPVFGVCLRHQCIGQAFGAKIRHARQPMHGKCSLVHHDGRGVFAGLPDPFEVVRYHSLVIDETTLPAELEVTARTSEGEIMGVRHWELPIEGVQFHTESLFTEHGLLIVANALAEAVGAARGEAVGAVSAVSAGSAGGIGRGTR